MSSEEITTVSHGPCLCGKGKVLHQFASPENPWSKPYDYYALSCGTCETEWEIFAQDLVHRGDKRRSIELLHACTNSEKAIRALMKDAINTYYSQFKHMTKQREKMLAWSLNPPNIDHYRSALKMGKTPADLCRLPGNTNWLTSLAGEEETKAKLSELLETHAANETAYEEFKVRRVAFL